MKKASKFLTLLLVAVLVLGVFSGCAVFGRNTEKYRAQVAMTVGNEEITIGKLIDTFNSYYNTYAGYIGQYNITVDSIFEMAVSSLYTQYMKIDAYKTSGVQPVNHTWLRDVTFANQGYLTESELRYAVKYVKYILYSTLDTMVEDYIDSDYGLKEAEEETEDTSRDFVEFDDLDGHTSYSEYMFAQTFENEEMEEYVSKYYENILTDDNIRYTEYVYKADEVRDMEGLKERIADLNERIEDSDPIDVAKYVEYQQQALKQYEKNVLSSYKYDLNALVTRQVEDFIISVIVAKYNYSVYGAIDHADLAETLQKLKDDCAEATTSQKTDFQINSNFVKFIEGLSNDSYVYYVPENYNYVFVKNILIPFTAEQKVILSNLEKQLGSDTHPLYLAKRTELASQIIADDFLSEKDEDGNYAKISDIFTIGADGKIAINTSNAELGRYFTADGHVVPMAGKSAEETIVELMKRFNTDVGQHSSIYDYVVRVGEVPESYTAPWVSEFVDAANAAFDAAAGANGGTYGIAISTYGVHIVYYTGNVEAQSFDFDANYLATDTAEYRLFKAYFSSQSNTLLEEALDSLKETYFADKIAKTDMLDKFLKENNLTFDFEKSISLEEEEE